MKKILSIILAFTMLFSIFLTGCVGGTNETGGSSEPSETPQETPFETPKETPDETPESTPDDPPEPEYDPAPAEGTLIFYENFENADLNSNSKTTIESLGWETLGKDNSQYDDGTADFTVKELNGSRALYIRNYNGKSGKTTYVEILSSEQLGFFHKKNYTYQYDITYTDASAGSEYINIISEHNGKFYNTYHLRNAGYANNQCCISGTFYRYAPTYTDSNSVATKLLGKKYVPTVQVLSNITVSVRYVVDWENGNKVYVRTLDKTTSSGGEWVLVSSLDPEEAGAGYFTPDAGGAGVVLKVSGGQNGYIDNIIIWSGTGDEPADKTKAYLDSFAECHRMVREGDTVVCALCGKTDDEIKYNWILSGVPAYEGGKPADRLYIAGQGMTANPIKTKENLMLPISDTNAEEFSAYLAKLERMGYKKEFYREADQNLFASYVKENVRVYTYFTSRVGEVRVIKELTENSVSLSEFGYEYTSDGVQTVIYQYAMPMRDATHFKADGYEDNGMFYVIRLADNSLVVIDGGNSSQFPRSQCDNFMKFLRQITGTKDGEKIKIAAWYVTHPHGDHYQGFIEFTKIYSSYIDLERLCFALTSMNTDDENISSFNDVQKAIINTVKNYYSDDNTIFLRLHTGQKITLANMCFEVLYTHEDAVKSDTSKCVVSGTNDLSSVIRMTIDGKTFLFMGDAVEGAMPRIMRTWSNEYLVSDGMQPAHHVLNDISTLYNVIKAPVLLIPQSLHRINERTSTASIYKTLKNYAREDMIFFQNEYTVGIAVVDGQWQKVYSLPVVYDIKK